MADSDKEGGGAAANDSSITLETLHQQDSVGSPPSDTTTAASSASSHGRGVDIKISVDDIDGPRENERPPSIEENTDAHHSDSNPGSALVPPNSADIKRVASVEIVPPEELPDIDDENFDELQHVYDDETVVQLKDAWRSRKHLANFLTLNHYFHIFVIVMVALDVMVVLVELILDLELIRDNECRKDSDCPITRRSNLSDTSSIQSCSYDTNFSHCIYIHGKHSCQLEETHHDIDPAEVFHYLGIAILSYFNLEVLVKLFALDIKFFKHKLEVFDAIVVITSLVLDITIGGEGARESVSLLILLRLWRITRIFNGITLAVEEREKEKRHKLKHDKDLALKDVDRLQKIVHELKVEIHEWRSRAHVEPTYKGLRHADELQSMIAEEEKKHHADGKHHGHHHHHHHHHGKNHHGKNHHHGHKNHLHGNHMQAPSSDSNHSLNSHGSAQSADKAV